MKFNERLKTGDIKSFSVNVKYKGRLINKLFEKKGIEKTLENTPYYFDKSKIEIDIINYQEPEINETYPGNYNITIKNFKGSGTVIIN